MTDTDLVDAIRLRDAGTALQVLARRPGLAQVRDEQGLSPLMLALYNGLGAVAEKIHAQGGNLDVFEAAAIGDVDRLRLVVSGPEVANSWSADGFTPLHLAAFFRRPAAIRLLVERGANLEMAARNVQFADGAHPLHSAVAARDLATVQSLLEAGADVNARQHGGYTPLLEAAQNGDVEIASALLARGADPAATLADGTPTWELARKSGHLQLADRLAKAAAARAT